MALVFEWIKNLTTEAGNTEPFFTEHTQVCCEPDSTIGQYFTLPAANLIKDKETKAPLGSYNVLNWSEPAQHITAHAANAFGVKNFPQIGAIGFYTDFYADRTFVFAPIRTQSHYLTAPTFTCELDKDTPGNVLITVQGYYDCYKIFFKNGNFIHELVTYEKECSVPGPPVRGDYLIYAVGYDEHQNMCSELSNVISLSFTSGRDTWSPVEEIVKMRLSDLLDVSLVDLLNNQQLTYNAGTGKWTNKAAPKIVEYCKRGLLFHWDGSKLEDGATQWTDEGGKLSFALQGCSTSKLGVQFAGTTSSYGKSPAFPLTNNYIIEIAFTSYSEANDYLLLTGAGDTYEDAQVSVGLTYGTSMTFTEYNFKEAMFDYRPPVGKLVTLYISKSIAYVKGEQLLSTGSVDGWGANQSIVTIGRRLQDPPVPFKGIIHSIRIYEGVLTDAERQNNYQCDISLFT